jgi:cytochrome c-type biogenesis protein CcmH
MTLWIIFGLMTAVALLAAGWPLARSRASASGASDVAVYRDQLEEIERDRADGRIGHDEFEAARVEVSRRLLGAAASAHAAASTAAAPRNARRFAVLACVVIAVPLVAVPFYVGFGSPDGTGEQFARHGGAGAKDTGGNEAPSIAVLVGRIEQHLKDSPDDSRGWEVIAPVYMRLERYDDAVTARRNLLSLLGPSAQREADLGVAMAMAAGGEVTADSKSAFERAVALDSGNVNAMFFLGVAAQQDGNDAEAARIWRDLIAKAPPDAPWLAAVRERLAAVSSDPAPAPGGYALAAKPRGPTSEDAAAVRGMTPEAQGQFMRDRIEALAARLHKDGTDVDGWLRLLRAYMVLGERDKANVVAREAREALARDPEKLKLLDAGLRDDEFLKDLAVRE